jgi:pre-mRNA-splicing factor ATP-dependent RNA helicase DHX15/PRP43
MEDLEKQTIPEILRSRIETIVLTLLKLGIQDLVHFDFLDPPAPETMMRALEELNYLGALDDDGNMTLLGSRMSELPLDPALAKMLLVSPEHNCSNDMLTIVARLSVPNIFMRPNEAAREADESKAQFCNIDGDHITMMNAYHAYKENGDSKEWCYDNFINYRSIQSADNVRNQLARILKKLNIPLVSVNNDSVDYFSNIRKCVAAGTFLQVAHLQRGGHYLTGKDNQVVSIHPSSAIDTKPQWVVYQEFVQTSKNFIRTCTSVRVEWLIEIAPHYFDLESWPPGETKDELERAYRRIQQEQEYWAAKNNKEKGEKKKDRK